MGTPHPLTGARLPRGRLTGLDGSTVRLYELFHEGRFVLLEASGPEGNGAVDNGAAGNGAAGNGAAGNGAAGNGAAGNGAAEDGLPDQVRRVRYAHCAGTRLPAAALVRPDGYVAWASDERDAQSRARAARAAVRWWCGSG
jgi:hypothetical protein